MGLVNISASQILLWKYYPYPRQMLMQKGFFSKYNLIKRKERNALKLETVRALINISECAKNVVGDEKFTPDREMVLSLRH